VSRKNTSHKDQEISILTIKKNQSKFKTRQCIFGDLPQAPSMGMDQLYTITSPPDFSCCPQYVRSMSYIRNILSFSEEEH
jgi:hypothetical protein